jgi:insulysin
MDEQDGRAMIESKRGGTGWRRMLTVRAGLLAALLAAVLGAGLLLGACQPRQIVPTQPSLLVQPERDQLQYRRLVLPNGLKVLLVSNPQADSSAAALAVGSGSLNDPPERPGLSHFLEHMLFLGTEKYPQSNDYTQYLSSHAGGSNAYTADDSTNFFFYVDNAAFEGALDRFSQFFVAPLFDQAYTDREMNAVDSEHGKNIENDYWRTRQVEHMQFVSSHPLNHFSTGNLETLRGTTREELLGFYSTHYSANNMTLAVVSNRGLDELERLVRADFGPVRNRELPQRHYPEQFLAPKPALRLLRVEPVADERALSLMFPLPPVVQDYDAKPLQLIGGILGHEGKGSLLSLLKDEGLAQSLSAGMGENTRDYASFEISIGLTPEGLRRYADVLRIALGAIEGLRRQGVPRYLFDESRVMGALNYRYREVPDSGAQARRLSAMMQDYPLEALPREPFLLKRYAPQDYQALLARMRPDNLLVTLVAKGVPTDSVERFYKAHFGYEELTGAPYQALLEAGPDPRWHVPAPNAFIPRGVALNEPEGPLKLARSSLYHLKDDHLPAALLTRLEPLQGESYTGARAFLARVQGVLTPAEQERWLPTLLADALPQPVRLLDTPQAKVWYQPDWRFRQPKAEVRLRFSVDGAYATPRRAMLASLYEDALDEALNEIGYPIKEAGLGYGIQDVKGGILLSLSGYSPRMLDLLQFLVERLQRIDLDERTFASLKEQARRGIVNDRLEQPYRQSQYFTRMLLERPNFTREALLAALEPLTLQDVQAYARTFLARTYVQGVVVGNLRQDEARAAIRRALDTLGAEVLPAGERVDSEVREIPLRANWVFSERLPVNNSLMEFLYQVGARDPQLDSALALIAKPLSEGFYHEMRTQQQLGYIVWAGAGDLRNVLNLYFIVQSAQYPADELRRRMDAFIPGFLQSFRAMPDAAFEQYRTAVVRSRLERAQNLSEQANSLYWSAFRNDERFDYVSEQLAALEQLTRPQVEAVLERALTGSGTRRLAIRLIGKGHAAGAPQGQVVELPERVRAKAG